MVTEERKLSMNNEGTSLRRCECYVISVGENFTRRLCESLENVLIFEGFYFDFFLLEFKWQRFIEKIQPRFSPQPSLSPLFETPKIYKHLEHRKYARIIFMAINHN